jgi:hypothetical protein
MRHAIESSQQVVEDLLQELLKTPTGRIDLSYAYLANELPEQVEQDFIAEMTINKALRIEVSEMRAEIENRLNDSLTPGECRDSLRCTSSIRYSICRSVRADKHQERVETNNGAPKSRLAKPGRM